MDLIFSHICTLRIYKNMVQVTDHRGGPNHEPVKRGVVSGFSAGARKRMLEMLNQLEFERMTFITLTYPDKWDPDGHEYKKHLRRFRARIERKFGKLRVLWRLEFQKRGAPHYHLLLFDAPWINKTWLSEAWYGSVGSGDPKHLEYGTNIKGIASQGENGKIIAYVAKYAAKQIDREAIPDDCWTGRYYGKWNIEKAAPIEVILEIGKTVRLVAGALSLRRSGTPYEPGSLACCRVFGHRMGSGEFGDIVLGTAQSLGAKPAPRKLDN
jgi:hypothetical protein